MLVINLVYSKINISDRKYLKDHSVGLLTLLISYFLFELIYILIHIWKNITCLNKK